MFRDFEILVQDAGSSDGTVEKVREFARGNAATDIKVFVERDAGPYDAMNKGVRRASGEWLYFLGSDDELHDAGVLAQVMRLADAVAPNVIYGDVRVLGDASWAKDGALYDGPFDLKKLLSKNICHQAVFYRTEFHRFIGEYNVDYAVCADWDFNLRCWAKTAFQYEDVTVARFRGGGVSSVASDERFQREFTGNVLRYLNLSLCDPLVNTATFAGFNEILAMRRSRAPLKRFAHRIAALVRGRSGLPRESSGG